ncbi:hypothetical protein [Trinickia mobilis]|uniref:hypothetical protein n=1 Tax=Trinickia mobilis TaxID=2816356 RepID=UPI001A9017CE|nr:hypothetical protein [Trinickia mobilis]
MLDDNEAALKNMLQVQQYFENYSARIAEFFPISCGMFFRIRSGKAVLAGKSAGDGRDFARASADERATRRSTPWSRAIQVLNCFLFFIPSASNCGNTIFYCEFTSC